MSIECLVGIDVGTTSTRIAIYGVDGTLFAAADSPHKIEHPRVGWAEQNAEVWWEGVCVATNKAFDRFNLIGFTGTPILRFFFSSLEN